MFAAAIAGNVSEKLNNKEQQQQQKSHAVAVEEISAASAPFLENMKKTQFFVCRGFTSIRQSDSLAQVHPMAGANTGCNPEH